MNNQNGFDMPLGFDEFTGMSLTHDFSAPPFDCATSCVRAGDRGHWITWRDLRGLDWIGREKVRDKRVIW